MEENVSPPEDPKGDKIIADILEAGASVIYAKPEIRNCKQCNKVLLPTRKNYCSKVCNWAYQNNRWNMPCATCGRIFMLPRGRRSHYRKAKDGTKTFCSRPCWVSWWHDNAKVLRANKINQNNNVQ